MSDFTVKVTRHVTVTLEIQEKLLEDFLECVQVAQNVIFDEYGINDDCVTEHLDSLGTLQGVLSHAVALARKENHQ